MVGSHFSGIKNDGNARLKIGIASNPLKETGLGVAQTLTFSFLLQPRMTTFVVFIEVFLCA